jgi:transcriptional regulator with XRE-family HTH domain
VTAGELLRETRKRHGLTQRQLAIRARTSQAAISRIERGVVSPSVETLGDLMWMMNEQLTLDAKPVDWGFDVSLIEARLALSPEERIRRGVTHSRRMNEIRGVAQRARA